MSRANGKFTSRKDSNNRKDSRISQNSAHSVETTIVPNGSTRRRTRTDSCRSRTFFLAGNVSRRSSIFSIASNRQHLWIEQKFHKRECVDYIQSAKDAHDRCGCGRTRSEHEYLNYRSTESHLGRWSIHRHTVTVPTDAYGTIEFQGGPHPHKAQFLRLCFDSEPSNVMHLFENIWQLPPPKLVITVHGGITNFNLQPKLARMFQSGLLKAAATTGAWIITSGLNSGAVRYVAAALRDTGCARSDNEIVTIGVAPWGLLKKRERFLGRDVTVQYHPKAFSTRSRFAVLSEKHSYFLFADNGTVGRYGADIILRNRLEQYLSRTMTEDEKTVPVVCVILEGGACTIRAVLEYATNSSPVPVVVLEGSGRASDLLAYAHRSIPTEGIVPEMVRDTLISGIQNCFQYSLEQTEKVYIELLMCVKKKHLITVFRFGEESETDVDHAILTALLTGRSLSAADQLSLALTWNRCDIARSDIFTYGREWSVNILHDAMMDALRNDRVDFVKLLLENGVQMEKFLTMQRLEDLYNTDKGPVNTLGLIIRDIVRLESNMFRYTLKHVGLVIEKLMGGAYEASYRSAEFCKRYDQIMVSRGRKACYIVTNVDNAETPLLVKHRTYSAESSDVQDVHFKFPFNDLFLWAVLTKRQEMANCMWQHGEDALPKALIASRLYKSLASEASDDYLEVEICEEFKHNAKYGTTTKWVFRGLALDLLQQCYVSDRDFTLQLLTYELTNWGRQTNIALAVTANHKDFLAHPCCQVLLSDLWHGGLRLRKYSNVRVLACLLCPPLVLTLNFKTEEQLQLQPQTAQEYNENMHDEHDDDVIRSWMDGGMQGRRQSDEQLEHHPHQRGAKFKRTSECDDEQWPYGNQLIVKQANNTRSRTSTDLSKSKQNLTKLANPSTVTLTSMYKPTFYQLSSDFVERPLAVRKKFYEFYVAPLTTFWIWTVTYISYGLFLLFFTYTVLTKMGSWPNWPEWYSMAYVVTLACENFRRMFIGQGRSFPLKLVVFFENRWNILYTISIWCFFIAVILRSYESTLAYARVVYACDIVFWYILLLDLMSVHHKLGVYVSMMGKMISAMFYLISILFVVLCSFGVIRQSIHFPNKDWEWQMARNVVYKPYFMLYGEVYAGEIDTCGDHGVECDVVGHWLTPAYMAAFMMVANILIINVMIAVFNYIFLDVNAKAQQVWKFSRYRVVLDYEYKPFLAPPFILLFHIYFVIKHCCRRRTSQKRWFDYALKLFLNEDGVEAVQDFEEQCMEDYHRRKDIEKYSLLDERAKRTDDRVERISMKLEDLVGQFNTTKIVVQKMEQKQNLLLSTFRHLTPSIAIPPNRSLSGDGSQDSIDSFAHDPSANSLIPSRFQPIAEITEVDGSTTPSPGEQFKLSLGEQFKGAQSDQRQVSSAPMSPAIVYAKSDQLAPASFGLDTSNPNVIPSMKASRSFILHENQVLREYEEDGGVVAGSLLGHRIRTTSVSLGDVGAEDLLEMGYDEEADGLIESQLRNMLREEAENCSDDSFDSAKEEHHLDTKSEQHLDECSSELNQCRDIASNRRKRKDADLLPQPPPAENTTLKDIAKQIVFVVESEDD